MPFTKDNITYPDSFDAAIKDARINKAFLIYLGSQSHIENYKFLTTGFDPELHYNTFISDSAKSQINLPGLIRNPMLALAKTANWDKAAWAPLIKAAKNEIQRLIEDNCLTGTGSFFRFQTISADTYGSRTSSTRDAPDPGS